MYTQTLSSKFVYFSHVHLILSSILFISYLCTQTPYLPPTSSLTHRPHPSNLVGPNTHTHTMTCSYLIILSQQLLLLKCVYLPSLLFPGRSNSLSRRRLLVHCLCPAIAVSEWRHRRRKALLLKQETPSFSCQLHCKTISSTTSQCHVYSCPAAACPTAAAVFLSSATLNEITFLLLLCASFIPAGFRCSVFFNFSLAQVWNIKWEHDLTSHTPYAGRASGPNDTD